MLEARDVMAVLRNEADAPEDLRDHALLLAGRVLDFDPALEGGRGYARALEWFDGQVAGFLAALRPRDLAIFTADHGNDPTWTGTDHTRERVPVAMAGAGAGGLGQIAFADVAATVAAHLGVPSQGPGRGVL